MELVLGVLATIVGGSALTLLLFLVRDQLFGVLDLGGPWTFTTETMETAYAPYKRMKLTYIALVWLEGSVVRGTAEKVCEEHGDNSHQFVGEKRVRISIKGHVSKRYLLSDHVVLHLEEHGLKRTSSSIQKLVIGRKATSMTGRFFSTAANSSGSVQWSAGTGGYGFDE